MGCDLHSCVEVRGADGWRIVDGVDWGQYNSGPFEWRNYSVFGWLADVRNYSEVGPVVEPRGFPRDASADVREDYEAWGMDAHTPSWLLLSELLSVDYDAEVNDRRVERSVGGVRSGAFTGDPEEGTTQSLRDFLGAGFMNDLETLKGLGAPDDTRVVFWFDN